MDIEEIKNKWSQITEELDKQKKFNSALFEKMIKNNINNSLQKIINYEIISIIALVLTILYTSLRFSQLDSKITIISGVFLIAISFFQILLFGILYKKIKEVSNYENAFSNTLRKVYDLKSYYYKYKSLYIINSIVYIFALTPVFAKLVHHRDIVQDFSYYIIPVSVGLLIGLAISFYMFKNVYERNLNKTENLLKDLKEN